LLLACVYDCLRFIVGALMPKLDHGDRELEFLLISVEIDEIVVLRVAFARFLGS